MPLLEVDGLKLHYLDEGSGPAVLLLHGFPLNSTSFLNQISALRGAFRLIAPDHRGFGRSPTRPGVAPMSRFAQDAVALLDLLGVKTAVVAGVSMGGYIAMELLRLEPARVSGLVLIGTHALEDDEAGKLRREKTALDVEQAGVSVLVDAMLGKLLAGESQRPVVEEQMRQASPEGAAGASRGMALRADSRLILSRFGGRALILHGEQDALIPVERARQVHGLIPGSRLAIIAGAGHLVNQEAPDAVNVELAAFLKS